MHPLDVKTSLSNEINVIRIECVKQKNPFSNLSHLPSSLCLHISQQLTTPCLWHWELPVFSTIWLTTGISSLSFAILSCDLDSGGSSKLTCSPSIHICI